MTARTFRCRIARLQDGFAQYVTYIGPVDRIPAGWSIVMRRVVGRIAA
jgi:hypothetical protein